MSHIHFKLVLTFKIEPKQGNVENVNRLKKKCEPACKMLNHSKKCWKNVGNVENVGSKIQHFFNIWFEPGWPCNYGFTLPPFNLVANHAIIPPIGPLSPPQRFWLGGRPIPPMPKSVCPRKGSVLKIKMSIKMKTFSPLFLLDMLLKGLEGWQPYQHCLHFKYQPQGHSLTACNALQPATHHRPLNPKWPTGSGNRLNLRLLDPLINFR